MEQEKDIGAVDLSDINPRKVAFTLKVIDNEGDTKEIELEFRPFILRDEEYIQRTWTTKEIKEIFENMKPKEMSMICYRQLTSESKKKISEIKVFDCDDDGNEFEIQNGYMKLMSIIGGIESQLVLHKSLLESKGFSMPMLSKIADALGKQEAQEHQIGQTSTMN